MLKLIGFLLPETEKEPTGYMHRPISWSKNETVKGYMYSGVNNND